MVVATFRLRFWRFLAGIKLAATNVHGFLHSLDPTDKSVSSPVQLFYMSGWRKVLTCHQCAISFSVDSNDKSGLNLSSHT